MPKLLPALLRPFRRRIPARTRPALILRLDNLAVLTDCLGAAAAVAMLGHIAGKIADDLRLRQPPRAGTGGDLCWRMPAMSDHDILDCAVRLQTLIQSGFGMQADEPMPVLAAAVVQTSDEIVRDDDLFARGQAWLDARRSVDKGRVALLSACVIAPADPALPCRDDSAAVDPSRMSVVFQPQRDCDTGAVSGFHAQARLHQADRRMLNPTDPTPAIDPARTPAHTLALLRHAIAALPRWDAAGFFVPQVSLAVTSADLAHADFADLVLWELDRLDLPPARLAFEVEGRVATDPAARQVLSRLTGCGCTLDLRDFGAGSASLEALRSLAPARVMIGPDFTADCDSDAGAQQIILAVLSLAGHLNLPTLARAVATPGEHGFLAQIGCAHVQGPAIAPAMTLADTLAYLDLQRSACAALPSLARHG